MTFFRKTGLRLPVVAIAAITWLAISQHCALAALASAPETAMTHCHSSVPDQKAPARDGESGLECCKILRATLLTLSKNAAAFDQFQFVRQTEVAAVLLFSPQILNRSPLELDTGPPFAGTFAESVLQRSILAHAPPRLA